MTDFVRSIHVSEWNRKLNTRCLGLRRVLFWLSKFIYTKLFGSAQSLHSVSVFQTFTPADCFMLRARSLTLDSALPKIWLRFTIFAKLFHFVQFSLLWSFLRKLLRRPLTTANKSKTEPFWLCFTHGLRLLPHNQAKRISERAMPRGANRPCRLVQGT